ncbi:hypothetical protein SAMN05518672_1011296 [Chitinophaga sp. CF118]|uniref:hypothetical protein n=1 Tax=Chitinophaga sp. CF118 TaxID=1884367 RepID=UPI0008EFEE14|nr:hypothetical protein [Chitinophaga sp. CF118]SFD25513.1 hypothetical protein SAMN05518672_1011296 [Chitinophaga sp. CF118]
MRANLLPVLLLALAYGCTAEQAPAPDPGIPVTACDTAVITSSYVLTSIAGNCTSRGCHKGTGATASSDFTTYAKLKTYLTSNEAIFRSRVISADADMPPSRFPDLSVGMRDSIACWISHGMPE